MNKLEIKNHLLIIVGLSLWLSLIIVYTDLQVIRIILGLPFVLFFPGFALITALFPGKDDLDGVERVALSFGLSIAVVPLIGLILNYTPWGIRLYPILTALNLFIIAMTIIGRYRGGRMVDEERFAIRIDLSMPNCSQLTALDKGLSVLLVGAVIFAAGSLYYVVKMPKVGEQFTEFYILGPGGKAEGYPRTLQTGEKGEVIVGVVNHEYQPVNYRMEVRMNGYLKNTVGPISLGHEEKWEEKIDFVAYETHKNIKDEFLLYREGDSEPYRKLHLWLEVVPEDLQLSLNR